MLLSFYPDNPRQPHVMVHLPTLSSYEVLAENTLDDGFDASPALVDNEIYLRGFRYLYKISQ